MNASVISRLVGILSSKDSHLRSNELCFLKYNDVNTSIDRWSVKLMIFFFFFFFFYIFFYHLSSILTIPLQKKCEETRDTIRRLKQSLSFSRRHYSIRKIITFSFFSSLSLSLSPSFFFFIGILFV